MVHETCRWRRQTGKETNSQESKRVKRTAGFSSCQEGSGMISPSLDETLTDTRTITDTTTQVPGQDSSDEVATYMVIHGYVFVT